MCCRDEGEEAPQPIAEPFALAGGSAEVGAGTLREKKSTRLALSSPVAVGAALAAAEARVASLEAAMLGAKEARRAAARRAAADAAAERRG